MRNVAAFFGAPIRINPKDNQPGWYEEYEEKKPIVTYLFISEGRTSKVVRILRVMLFLLTANFSSGFVL